MLESKYIPFNTNNIDKVFKSLLKTNIVYFFYNETYMPKKEALNEILKAPGL